MAIDFQEVGVVGLSKSFGSTLALGGIDLSFGEGSLTVVLGANGSGKSTLLSLLALLARPTRGEVRYGRYRAHHAEELRSKIGLVAHQLQLYPGLTGRENLLLAAKFHRISYAQKRTDDLCEALSVGDYWDRTLRTYSRGQAQRIAIARALLHEPRLLLMDEPATGLDADATATLIELIAQQKQQGAIVVVVTHDKTFASSITDLQVKLERGRLVEGVS